MLRSRISQVFAVLAAVMIFALSAAAQAPGVPALSSPTNGEGGQSTAVTLNWNSVSGASSYTLQVSTGSTFSAFVVNQAGLPLTSGLISGLMVDIEYHWRVDATGSGGTSAWSNIWSFGTFIVPRVPIPEIPPNGDSNLSLSLSLFWDTVTAASSYAIQVSTISNFITTFISQTGITTIEAGGNNPRAFASLNGLANKTTYYWKVNAAAGAGRTSAWSGIWSFSTPMTLPGAPLLSNPTNNEINVTHTPYYYWQMPDNSETYTFQLSSDSNFSTTIQIQSGPVGAGVTADTLAYTAIYFWHVNGTNSLGTGPWSSTWSFTVSAPAPTAAPELISPTNGYTVATPTTFSWGMVAGAASYELTIDSIQAMHGYPGIDVNILDLTLSGTHWTNDGMLIAGSGYLRWKVCAATGSGSGP